MSERAIQCKNACTNIIEPLRANTRASDRVKYILRAHVRFRRWGSVNIIVLCSVTDAYFGRDFL